MEQQKKFSVFDIVNTCILGLGVIFAVISIFVQKPAFSDTVGKVTIIISDVATIVAFITAAIYMISRYTKKSAPLYKIFMYSFVAVSAMLALFAMTLGSGSMLSSILIVAILLLSVVLATAKDFGIVKTFIIAGLLLVAHIILCFTGFTGSIRVLSFLVNIILTAEACIMVLAKYDDKTSRGAK